MCQIAYRSTQAKNNLSPRRSVWPRKRTKAGDSSTPESLCVINTVFSPVCAGFCLGS
jgi:hypothetical protein